MPRKTRQYKRRVVHLGNLGYWWQHEKDRIENPENSRKAIKLLGKQEIKTGRYVRRFPETLFIGIDRLKLKGKRPENWNQLKTNFEKGLKKLKDNSVDIISSEAALGYYGKRGEELFRGKKILEQNRSKIFLHTLKTLQVAFKKLKQGGKLLVLLGSNGREIVLEALKQSPFSSENIIIRETTQKERQRTYFSFGAKYQITVTK